MDSLGLTGEDSWADVVWAAKDIRGDRQHGPKPGRQVLEQAAPVQRHLAADESWFAIGGRDLESGEHGAGAVAAVGG